tara:strand:+ start:210 stop:458 length:249 start_codon:yes stop_codon:yes gene_type:complete
MSDLLDNLKVLLPILTVVAVGAGFYYTTNHRLDHLEEVVNSMKADNKDLHLQIYKIDDKLKKQEEAIIRMRKTLSKKQDRKR